MRTVVEWAFLAAVFGLAFTFLVLHWPDPDKALGLVCMLWLVGVMYICGFWEDD